MKNRKSENQQSFLLSFFAPPDKYEEKEVKGFVLVRHWDGNQKKWTVNVYTKESFIRFKAFPKGEIAEQNEHIKNLLTPPIT